MSWLYSGALVAGFLAGTCSAGGACAPSSATPAPLALCAPDKMTDISRLSRFGMTFAPLTGSHGEELLTWYLAGFPAKTSASPERARDLAVNAADSGQKWPGSLVKLDRDSHSWKTHQLLLTGDLEPFSETWPRWGMMRAGECWALATPERRTSGSESGLWLPTPDTGQSQNGHGARGGRPGNGRQSGASLSAMAKHGMWPTPTVCGNYNRKGSSPQSGDGLATAVKKFPTPTCQDATNNGGRSQMQRHTRPLNAVIGGALNPTWVEWLMGWPLGWTDLKPLATAKFQAWQNSHGKF